MTRPRFNPITFFQELRRRRVFRVAVLYGVGAWGVIAACDVLFPQLTDWVADPDRAMRAVFIAAILLFPVALVFGWLYDVTAEGIQRTADFSETAHDPDTSLHPVDRGIIGTLSVLVIAVLALTSVHIVRMPPPMSLAGAPGAPTAPENSIAVLPFEICEGPGVDPLLAAGIANEVLRHLAEIPNLKVTARSLLVIARASAFAFAETDMEPQQIASTLRVHYLLTGTVCRDGDALTVKAELVDESGYLVWSDSYTEQLDATGQVTRSVAVLLAEGVAGRLGAVMQVTEDEPVDRLAYEQLLIGREFRRNNESKARAAFEAALDRKPDYAEAVYELAMMELPTFDNPDHTEALEKFRLLAGRALAMARREMERNPNSAQANFVTGRITLSLLNIDMELSWRNGELPQTEAWDRRRTEAERLLRRSIELNPSESAAYFWLFLTLEEQGRNDEARAVLERALDRDPFNLPINRYVALRWAELGRNEEAVGLLARFKKLPDVPSIAWYELFHLAMKRGRFDDYCELLVEMRHQSPAEVLGQPWHYWDFVGFLADLGQEQESKAWRERMQHLPLPWWMRSRAETTRDEFREYFDRASGLTDEQILDGDLVLAIGMAAGTARVGGDYDRAIRLLERLRRADIGHDLRQLQPWAEVMLASLYQTVGRRRDAETLLTEIETALESKVNAGNRLSVTLDFLAKVYALQGKAEAALATLETSAAVGNQLVTSCMRDFLGNALIPGNFSTVGDAFQSLRGEARFHALDERCEAEKAQQVARIRSILAERDPDTLLAPFINITAEQLREMDEHFSGLR